MRKSSEGEERDLYTGLICHGKRDHWPTSSYRTKPAAVVLQSTRLAAVFGAMPRAQENNIVSYQSRKEISKTKRRGQVCSQNKTKTKPFSHMIYVISALRTNNPDRAHGKSIATGAGVFAVYSEHTNLVVVQQ